MLQPPIVEAAPPSPALTSSTSAPSIFSALTSPVAVPPPAALSVSSKSPAEKGPKERSESVAKSIGSSVEASNPKKKAKPKKKKKKYAYDPYIGVPDVDFSNEDDVDSKEIDIVSSGTSDAEGKSSSDDGDENSEDENKKKDWAALRTQKWIANEKAREARKRRKIKEKAKELHKQHVANENKKDPTWDPSMEELEVLQAGPKININ